MIIKTFFRLKPGTHGAVLARFGRLRQILKILKDSYSPWLKSVASDRWFDMFTDSRLTAAVIKLYLDSGSVRRCGTQSCSVTSTMNSKRSSRTRFNTSLTLMRSHSVTWSSCSYSLTSNNHKGLLKITQYVPGLRKIMVHWKFPKMICLQ